MNRSWWGRRPRGGDKGKRHPDHAAIEALTRSLAAKKKQRPGLTVEALIGESNGSYSYAEDRLIVELPGVRDASHPHVAAVIAHELGHREDDSVVVRYRFVRHVLVALGIAMIFLAVGCSIAGLSALLGASGVMSLLVVAPCLVVGAAVAWLAGVALWPSEFRADASAALEVGKEAAIDNLESLTFDWLDLEHPPRWLRIAAVRKLPDR